MIFHIMKDGTRRDHIDGYIVKYEQKKELYRKMSKLKGKNQNGNNNTSGAITKTQILDR